MNKFINTKKAIQLSSPFWQETSRLGLIGINSTYPQDNSLENYLINAEGNKFINMCSYSYLGLDGHPSILEGAIEAVRSSGTINSTISRVRVCLDLLTATEEELSTLFENPALTVSTCAAASMAVLPLLAAGVFTKGIPPIMLFDKHAHFSINLLKPICADETEVLSCNHNDLNYIEDICKRNRTVAYIADGVYSTGGSAPIDDLLTLQNKYGLFLFFDEAHSISARGKNGIGLVLDKMNGKLNDKTMIVASLNKAFGASGGLILVDKSVDKDTVLRYGGPLSWSQRINTAGLGAVRSAIKIHTSGELLCRQKKLIDNINYFDSLITTEFKGDCLPIRFIPIDSEVNTVRCSQAAYEAGFYTSPLFFPIVPKGKSGLRVMIRSDLTKSSIQSFCNVVMKYTTQEIKH